MTIWDGTVGAARDWSIINDMPVEWAHNIPHIPLNSPSHHKIVGGRGGGPHTRAAANTSPNMGMLCTKWQPSVQQGAKHIGGRVYGGRVYGG